MRVCTFLRDVYTHIVQASRHNDRDGGKEGGREGGRERGRAGKRKSEGGRGLREMKNRIIIFLCVSNLLIFLALGECREIYADMKIYLEMHVYLDDANPLAWATLDILVSKVRVLVSKFR